MIKEPLFRKTKVFVLKRSTRNSVLIISALGFAMGFMQGTNTSISLEGAKKIPKMILEGFIISAPTAEITLKDQILNDYENKISDDFSVPEGLKSRVGFWFDIYSKYDSNHKIIHHSRFPWIIFKVVDTTSIINSDSPKARWMRNLKAEKFVSTELDSLKKALKKISQTGQVDDNDPYQRSTGEALKNLEGSLQSSARLALDNIRIQTGQKNFFADGLKISPTYLPGMEAIFKKHKLPSELTRLPFVESSFNRNAVSKVGASGIWQFMDYTGKNFLTVTDHIDERNSPFKATEAAARLLKENHMILHKSWPLAITAWNHGPGGVRKAIKSLDTKDIEAIVNSYQTKTFDFASSNFYCEFLAALYTEKYHEKLFDEVDYHKEIELHKVKLSRSVPAKELVRQSGLSKEDFIVYNPDLKKAIEKNISIPSGFHIMVDSPSRLSMRNLITKSVRDTRVSKLTDGDLSYNSDTNN